MHSGHSQGRGACSPADTQIDTQTDSLKPVADTVAFSTSAPCCPNGVIALSAPLLPPMVIPWYNCPACQTPPFPLTIPGIYHSPGTAKL